MLRSWTGSGRREKGVFLGEERMNRKGMFSLEQGFLIVILVSALLAMSVYLTRSICGKMRASADVFGYGRQYSPP